MLANGSRIEVERLRGEVVAFRRRFGLLLAATMGVVALGIASRQQDELIVKTLRVSRLFVDGEKAKSGGGPVAYLGQRDGAGLLEIHGNDGRWVEICGGSSGDLSQDTRMVIGDAQHNARIEMEVTQHPKAASESRGERVLSEGIRLLSGPGRDHGHGRTSGSADLRWIGGAGASGSGSAEMMERCCGRQEVLFAFGPHIRSSEARLNLVAELGSSECPTRGKAPARGQVPKSNGAPASRREGKRQPARLAWR